MPFTPPATISPQLELALEYLEAAGSGDGPRFASTLHDDLHYRLLLPSLDQGPMNKSQVLTFLGELGTKLSNVKFTLEDVVEAPGKVWLYATSKGTIVANGAPYANQCLFLLDIAPDASGALKVAKIGEMVDSKPFTDVLTATAS